jgi:GlpG protein
MRELHTFHNERHANLLADVLKARSMPAEVMEEDGAWIVWVMSDDHREKAREVLAEFQKNPDASEFASAAKSLKQQQADARAKDQRTKKLQVRVQDRWSGVWWKTYPATMILIGISIAVVMICTDWQRTSSGRGMIPATCNDDESALLDAMYMKPPGLVVETPFLTFPLRAKPSLLAILKSGQVWRFVTPIFLHFSVLHIFFNMMWLKNLGRAIEFNRGTWRFLALILVLAVASNIGQYWWVMTFSPKQWPENFGGMSGVDFGLIGYLWMKGRTQPQQGLGIPRDQLVLAILWMLLCIGGAFGPIANAAHVFGFGTGMLLGSSAKCLEQAETDDDERIGRGN